MEKRTPITDAEARASAICPGCGGRKDVGPVVCWERCWRGQGGLKYSGLDTGEWLPRRVQLNAAAPSLLAALQDALVVISQHYPDNATCCAGRVANIRAALAKAGI